MKPDAVERALGPLRAKKRQLDAEPKPRVPRKPTAAERTADIPGVDTREQEDHSAGWVEARGTCRRVSLGDDHTTHLATHRDRALCGVPLRSRADFTNRTLCPSCRAEASRLRLEVV